MCSTTGQQCRQQSEDGVQFVDRTGLHDVQHIASMVLAIVFFTVKPLLKCL